MGKTYFVRNAVCVLIGAAIVLTVVGCGGGAEARDLEKRRTRLIACSQPEVSDELPEVSGGITLAVGGETITVDEVVVPLMDKFAPVAKVSDFDSFRSQAGDGVEDALSMVISNSLLYQEAKKNAPDGIDELLEDAVEKQVNKFIASFDGDRAKAENALKKVGMDWESFKKSQGKMMLTQSYVSQELEEGREVTYGELLDYYNAVKDEKFFTPGKSRFSLIDIQPGKLELGDPNEDSLLAAKKLAEEIIGRLDAGEDFAELAKKYSHGHRAEFGGLWREFEPDSLAAPYAVLEEKTKQTEVGGICGPVETDGHIFILKVEAKHRPRSVPFEQVQHEIEKMVKYEHRKEAVNKMMAKLADTTIVGSKERFIEQCLKEIYITANQ